MSIKRPRSSKFGLPNRLFIEHRLTEVYLKPKFRERLNDVLPHDAPDFLARLMQCIDPEVASFVHQLVSRVFVLVHCITDGLFSFPKLRRLARQLKVLNSLLKVLHGIGV